MYDSAVVRCGSDEHLLSCELSSWEGRARCCRWCNAELSGRKQRWCSSECANENGRNHWWTYARHAALRRDESRCVQCAAEGVDLGIGARGLQVHHMTALHTLMIDVKTWMGNDDVFSTRRVHHSDGGCWHHLDGLVTLCKPCHLAAHRATPAKPGQLEIVC